MQILWIICCNACSCIRYIITSCFIVVYLLYSIYIYIKYITWKMTQYYHIISYHIISYHILAYHILAYHIISYHIISYHIISYHIILYCVHMHITCVYIYIWYLCVIHTCIYVYVLSILFIYYMFNHQVISSNHSSTWVSRNTALQLLPELYQHISTPIAANIIQCHHAALANDPEPKVELRFLQGALAPEFSDACSIQNITDNLKIHQKPDVFVASIWFA